MSMGKELVPIMTVDDIAEYLRIPKSSVYKLAQQGKIPSQNAGRHWCFHQKVIENQVSRRQDVMPGRNITS